MSIDERGVPWATIVGVMDEILAELKSINAKLAVTNQQAKIEIKTSTRGTDVTVTAYEQTDAQVLSGTSDIAVGQYRHIMRQLSNEIMSDFAAEAARHEPA